MQLPSTPLTEEQSAAIVDCIIALAKHGRAIRLQREAEQQKTKLALPVGEPAASLVDDSTTLTRSVIHE